ncbi:hypothetical protein M3S04_07225 [Xanthomonas sp. PPL139]|uniref:hypothetical protein n=1 Tax=unclassified Xanthomonas TaxID=2643310 RepID=UPI00339F25FA
MVAIDKFNYGVLLLVFLSAFVIFSFLRAFVIIAARNSEARVGALADAAEMELIPLNTISQLISFISIFFRIFIENKNSAIGIVSLLTLALWLMLFLVLLAGLVASFWGRM